ncbi:MAG: DUF5666 domain-containing protein, partial [Armatimonadota bacterium]
MKRTAVALLIAFLLALVGCGGGGSTASGGGAGSTSVNTFVTDDFTPLYDQVWVTLYTIDLVKDDDTVVSVYVNADGEQIDVRALTTGLAGKYRFLGTTSIPAGTYKGFNVTVAKSVSLYAVGSSTPTVVSLPDELDAGAGKSQIKVTFPKPRTFASGDAFPIDFKLKDWAIVAGRLVCKIVQGDGSGIDDGTKHEQHGVDGVVSELAGTAPSQTFTLTAKGDDRRHISVTTNEKTVVLSAEPNTNPELANGQSVEVEGTFDVTTKTFLASTIHIRPAVAVVDQKAEGLVYDASAEGKFNLQVSQARGFVPAERKVHVVTSDSTQFFDAAGAPITSETFYSTLLATPTPAVPKAEVEGTYNKDLNTFNARKAKIDTERPPEQRKVELEGAVSAIDGKSNFTVKLAHWNGFAGSADHTIQVLTDASTTFETMDGTALSADDFYAALAVNKVVEVQGLIQEGGKVLAVHARIRQEHDGDAHDKAQAFGIPASVNIGDGTLELMLIKWDGFDSAFGTNIHV